MRGSLDFNKGASPSFLPSFLPPFLPSPSFLLRLLLLLLADAVECAWTRTPYRIISQAQEAVEWAWTRPPYRELRGLWSGPGPELMPEECQTDRKIYVSERMPE